MRTQYPNTYKAISSNNELINDIAIYKTFLRPLHDMSITLEMIITGYPKVLKWYHSWRHKLAMELHKNSNAP